MPLMHQRDFHLNYILDILLCMLFNFMIFKDLPFPGLCLVLNNIDFVLSGLKCILNFLSTNQSSKLEKSLISCFPVSMTILCWKTKQVS